MSVSVCMMCADEHMCTVFVCNQEEDAAVTHTLQSLQRLGDLELKLPGLHDKLSNLIAAAQQGI